MASLPKKRRNETLNLISIRLCDSFKRTPQNFICPFIRAEESVRVFYRLKQESLKKILSDAGTAVDLELNSITWRPGHRENITLDGNIFIEYKSSTELWDEDTFTKYKDFVKPKLEDVNIKYILVDQVMELSTVSQPVITEIDYKIYELDCKFQSCLCQYQNSAEPDSVPDDLENIIPLLQELKDRQIQIAVLSHNAIGKSFLLNLLLLLTAESNKKSGDETTKKMPEDIIGNPTVKMVKEEQFEDLPEVIKDFLDEFTDDEQDFKNLVKPICHQLHCTDHEELRRIESSFKSLSGYFTDQMRIDLEPYLLPQKDIFGDYNATTNCVFYLRYGTSFQAKVEYFDEKELQNQLFELVSLEKGSTERRPEFVNEGMQEKAEQSLKARFKILTKNVPDNHNEKTLEDVLRLISSPGEIELCEQLKEFVGKTELYIGNGKNPSADRFALQKLLKEFTLSANDEDDYDDDDDKDNKSRIMKQKIASLKRLVVYVPSTLLYGGIEILEMPGTNDSDPLAMSFIQDALDEVEVVLLLSEFGFRLAGQEVRDCLTNSRFITHWKRNYNEYKLMFVSYPEKNHIYQFCARDLDRLEEIMMQNNRKQEEEFQSLNDLLHPVHLTPEMKQNIFSSTLLPVLHSSILSLEGDPFDVLKNNKDFLKNSGIDLLLTEFHHIIIQKKKVTILEIEKRLEDFEASRKGEANDEPENDTPPEDDTQPATQIVNFEQERKVLKTKENFFNKMKEEIEGLIKDTVDGSLKEILERWSLNVVDKWAEIKNEIPGTALFNPQHSGRHPAYKIKMDNVVFENLDKEISPVLKDLIEKLEQVVDDRKKKAVTSFKEDLQKKAEKAMEDALTGFLGMTRTSFNENTLMKSFESLCKENMKKYLLEPAYSDTIENLKNKMEPCIHQVLNKLQRSFSQETISLYKERWPANLAKVMVRICIPLKSIQSSQPSCTFCGKPTCRLCDYIESTATFTSTNKKKIYPVSGSLTCASKYVIYLITCKKCKKQYVGQTRQEVRKRFIDHLSRIRCNKKGLSEHFNMDGHSEIALVIIEEEKNLNRLLEKEKYWIRELGTLKPAGLNARY